jgi:hypothetical protein
MRVALWFPQPLLQIVLVLERVGKVQTIDIDLIFSCLVAAWQCIAITHDLFFLFSFFLGIGHVFTDTCVCITVSPSMVGN